jgi:hypothetical protein
MSAAAERSDKNVGSDVGRFFANTRFWPHFRAARAARLARGLETDRKTR